MSKLEKMTDATMNKLDFAGQEITVADSAQYLRKTATRKGVKDNTSVQGISQATGRIGFLARNKINDGNATRCDILAICKTYVYTMAIYTLQLVPVTADIDQHEYKWGRDNTSSTGNAFGKTTHPINSY